MNSKDIDNLLKLVNLNDEKCMGKFDKTKGGEGFLTKPEYRTYDYAFLLCLVKGVKGVCIIDVYDKWPHNNVKFVNLIIKLANKSCVRCIMETYHIDGNDVRQMVAFKSEYYLNAIFLTFLEHIVYDVIDDKFTVGKLFKSKEKIPLNSVYNYRIWNSYNFGKTLGYREQYIENFYIFLLGRSRKFSEKKAIALYNRDKKMYPILLDKLSKYDIFKKLYHKHLDKIKKIPLVE